jgi:hypothetical protein
VGQFGLHARRPVQFEVHQRGPLQLAEQLDHARCDLGRVRDEGVSAAPGRRQFTHKPVVRRRADAHREQARVAELSFRQREHLGLVAHAAVGDEHHLAQQPGRGRHAQRQLQGRQHVRAAVGIESRDVALRRAARARIHRQRRTEQGMRRVVELDDVEAVHGAETGNAERQRRPRLLDGGAAHGAGGVDNEDHLPRRTLVVHPGRRS